MYTRARSMIGAMALGSAILLTPVAASAAPVAAPDAQRQSGLVNVSTGDVLSRNNVGIGVAAQIAAQVCGVAVGPVAVLATQVARTGLPQTVCNNPQAAGAPVTISPAA
jgi:hypothetical protein